MVETVIVLPLLLMVLFAIVEFGIVFGRWQALSNAAREGARLAIVYRSSVRPGRTSRSDVRARVEEYVAPLGLDPGDIEVEIDGACGARGSLTTVTVDSHLHVRVLRGFAESLAPSLDLSGSSVMRNEGSG